jgi:hypothetical protein
LSSSSPSSRQRFPSPRRSRGHRPFPLRNDQPPGDRRPRIGRRQRGVAVLASPRSRDSPRSDSSSDVVAPQSIVGGGAVPTVVVVVAIAPASPPPLPYFKLIVVSSLSPLNERACVRSCELAPA